MRRVIIFLKEYWPSLLTLAVILYATLSPDPELARDLPPIPHLDKLIHAVMMGGLFGAILFDTARKVKAAGGQPVVALKVAGCIAVAVMLFSIVDEILQKELTTTRSAEFLDIVADWVGIAVAFVLAPPSVRKVLS